MIEGYGERTNMEYGTYILVVAAATGFSSLPLNCRLILTLNIKQTADHTHKTMKNLLSLFAMIACAGGLTGCGTTSDLKPVSGADIRNIHKYNQVSVLDFGVKSKGKAGANPELLPIRGIHFADLIATELESTKVFGKVSRAPAPLPGSLLVSGDITRLTEGSASLRLWVGMGAGSSYFDATVNFSDTDTAQKLGEILVDKNSWGLGGSIAEGQTVEVFMQAAAKKVAEQVAKAKSAATAVNKARVHLKKELNPL